MKDIAFCWSLQPSDGKYLIVFTFRDKKLKANKYPSFDGPQLSDGWQGQINADADWTRDYSVVRGGYMAQ